MDSQGPKCITEVAGFELVCLNPFVLETAYLQFRQEHDVDLDTTQAEKYRYTGYRQIVRWCYGFLRRSTRVPLPSCVVSRIRTEGGVRDFSNRVNKAFRDLTARQRAEGQRSLDEQILREQFISGLQDGILMRQVRAKTMEGPGLSFIDVRSYAIKWELQETNMRKPAPHVEAAVASAEPQHALTDLTK
ncbi:hypothetical protein ACOMHN_045760 [Nucella lapillus]